jgi:hypothetical protein
VEVGLGDLAHVGVNYSQNYGLSQSTRWTADNDAQSFYGFFGASGVANTSYRPLHEVFYFKEAGEKTIGDPAFDAGVGGVDAVRIRLEGQRATGIIERKHSVLPMLTVPVSPARNSRTQREKRQQVLTALTATEASTAGLSTTIEEFARNDFDMSTGRYRARSKTGRVSGVRKGHHLSELTVLKPDGARYVYGIPAYNNVQKDVTFAVKGGTGSCATGLVTYENNDNSTDNGKGTDNYFSRTTLPGYAHSYLMTAVLSPDYADRSGDGVSDDDPGTSVKINYTREHAEYPWRIPYDKQTASFNEGVKSNPNDDKGSYIYGTKEMWYVHSIETKTHVAEFSISSRHDGFGVENEDGGRGHQMRSYKLDSIRLFSKEDRIRNGAGATPIKTVHLLYDNALCTGILNTDVAGGGKLTLRSVYFTYGVLAKGAANAYHFDYSTVNPTYDLKGYDRWGSFKENANVAECEGVAKLKDPTAQQANPDDPYVVQNKSVADANASAWQLTRITLPSKGTIAITYESDDYAFVQNRRAMRMIPVIGAAPEPTEGQLAGTLFDEQASAFDGYVENKWLCFDLPTGVTTREQLRDLFLTEQTKALHFRFLVDITGKDDYEYVSGYAELEDHTVTKDPAGNLTRGWVRVKRTTLRDKENGDFAHPISKAAWQKARIEMGSKIFPGSDPQGEGESAITGLIGFGADLRIMFTGFNRTLRGRGFGQKFVVRKSTIRLGEPSHRRLGGGSRVRRVESSDEWSAMAGGTATSASYGQEFTYTMSGNESDEETSSGVAAYEPMVGSNENPFHEPISFTNRNFMAPDDQVNMEKPYGESHFPDPSVGYRRVTIRDIYDHSKHTATGKVVHEYYTSFEFPTRVSQTSIALNRVKPKFLDKLFKAKSIDYLAVSQGYAIEKSAMDGTQRSQMTYAEGGTTPISGVEYFYRRDPSDPRRLRSLATVIDSAGVAKETVVGRDIDMVIDMRQTLSNSQTTDITANVEAFTLAPVAFIPSLWGKSSVENTRFRSAVVTKAIYVYGILDSVVAYEDGARVSTVNLAIDAETGEVLLTRTANTFRDPVYNFTYPAHWAFDGMGPAYRNVGARLPGVVVNGSGLATVPGATRYLTQGDEVLLTGPGASRVAWVVGANASSAMLVGRYGEKTPAGSYDLLVVRSGRRNKQSSPIGTVSSLANPLAYGRIPGIAKSKGPGFYKVLNAEAIEYSDVWGTTCGSGQIETPGTLSCDSILPAAKRLGLVLNDLASQGRLTISGPLDATLPSYTSPLAATSLPHVWAPNANAATTPLSQFDASISGRSQVDASPMQCAVTLTAQSSLPWYDVVGFGPMTPDPAVTAAGINHRFLIDAHLANGTSIQLRGESPCDTVSICTRTPGELSQCGSMPGQAVNPFILGLRGNWRRLRSHAYLVNRNPASTQSSVSTRYDGQYASFTPFWLPPAAGSSTWGRSPSNWTWTAQVTRFGPDGFERENQDALGRYSGALYGYLNTLPTSVASNAPYRSIAYDGFEDYRMAVRGRECPVVRHWDFGPSIIDAMLDPEVSHTGKFSLRLDAGTSASVARIIGTDCTSDGTAANAPPALPLAIYKLKPCDCNELFSPTPDGEYVFSGWVRENLSSPFYDDGSADVTLEIAGAVSSTVTLVASGLIIEGWRRIDTTFVIPAGATEIKATLRNGSSAAGPAWFDDLRIHPFNATVKSYVFDPVTLRLMAILDERNFASLYEYNSEGQLIRLKKETERGIATIQESRSDLRKYTPSATEANKK